PWHASGVSRIGYARGMAQSERQICYFRCTRTRIFAALRCARISRCYRWSKRGPALPEQLRSEKLADLFHGTGPSRLRTQPWRISQGDEYLRTPEFRYHHPNVSMRVYSAACLEGNQGSENS